MYDGSVYLAAAPQGTFYRFPVDDNASPSGDPVIITHESEMKSFDRADDGTIYAALWKGGEVVKITLHDDLVYKESTVIAGKGDNNDILWRLRSVALGRTEGKKKTLYAATMYIKDGEGSRILSMEMEI
ncbi:hypothetical protein IMZ48_29340 [Candidatus Bathyarchaeota archaeon]|nr:hypothetical protein [Candidatus Bathyarchaeota archaeon]